MFGWKTIDKFSTFSMLFAFILPLIFLGGIFHEKILWVLFSAGLFAFELISRRKFIVSLYKYNKKTKAFVIKIIILFFVSMFFGIAGKTFLVSPITIVIPAIPTFFICWFGAKTILSECNELIENEFKRK